MKETLGVPNPSVSYSPNPRLAAHKITKPVNFTCRAPEAGHVAIMGDFNQWDRDSHPMERQPDGSWIIQVRLPLGYHHYLYLVDGEPTLDPAACGIARDEFGQKVSLLAVS